MLLHSSTAAAGRERESARKGGEDAEDGETEKNGEKRMRIARKGRGKWRRKLRTTRV